MRILDRIYQLEAEAKAIKSDPEFLRSLAMTKGSVSAFGHILHGAKLAINSAKEQIDALCEMDAANERKTEDQAA